MTVQLSDLKRNNTISHPGVFLSEELEARDWTQTYLATLLHKTKAEVNYIIKGSRGITADMATRLGIVFGTGAQFWLNYQNAYDLSIAQQTKHQEYQQIKNQSKQLAFV